MCDRVGVMYAGKVVEMGDVFTVFNAPRHPYTAALLGSLPTVEGDEVSVVLGSGDMAREN